MSACSKCNGSLKEGARFCSHCGAPVAAPAVSAPSSVVQATQPVQAAAQTPQPNQPKKASGGRCCIIGCVTMILIGLAIAAGLAIWLLPKVWAASNVLKEAESLAVDGAPAPKDVPSTVRFAPQSSGRFGFVIELPDTWIATVKNGTPLFYGPDGTDQSDVAVNLQFIQRTAGSSLDQQGNSYLEQLKAAGSTGSTNRKGMFHGFPAVYLFASFPVNGAGCQQVQIIVERDEYYYWISYTAPKTVFDKYQYVLNHAVATFRFTPIVKSPPTQPQQPPPTQPESSGQPGGGFEELGRQIDKAMQDLFGTEEGNATGNLRGQQ
jgi:hypothetical protein